MPESGLYHQGLSPGKWLVFGMFSCLFPTWNIKLEPNLYFSLLGERILLIVVYNFFVLSFPQLLSQIQTTLVFEIDILNFSLFESMFTYEYLL